MSKRLNTHGKLLHAFTAFFPMYIYWAYFFFTKIESWNLEDMLNFDSIMFVLLCLSSVLSIFLFYKVILKRTKSPDKEFNVTSSEKKAAHTKYVVGSLSPFILFLGEFVKDNNISLLSVIVGTIFFVIVGLISIIKEETGILYNIFYVPYNILNVKTNNGKEMIILSKQSSLSGFIKVYQLDKMVFKEWN